MNKDLVWVEKYRPKTIDEYICDSKLKDIIKEWIRNKTFPNLLLAGPPGTGKTSLARLLIKEIGAISLELNASDERTLDVLRGKIKRFAFSQSLGKPKVILLDEYDYVTIDFQVVSRGIIEKFSKGNKFILTCNYLNRIIDAIQSRCKVIKITEMPKKKMAIKCIKILQNESVKFEVEELKKLINMFYPDMRKIINTLQLYSISGKLQIDFRKISSQDYKLKIYDLIFKKELKTIRQVVANEPVDFIDMYKFLFQKFENPRLLLIIADYLYKDSLVVDKEINFIACTIELMGVLDG